MRNYVLSLFFLHQTMLVFAIYFGVCDLQNRPDQVHIVLTNYKGKDWQVDYIII